MATRPAFTFEISLSVLNHLGRHLYRSFGTVLGEAISNAWDADARNVWIYCDKNGRGFTIKDDGEGMSAADFQDKFLRIGYSKRKGGRRRSARRRPFIGRKGIGKLALLSCADRITVISKQLRAEYVGGVIDNSSLDEAITQDLTPERYSLERANLAALRKYTTKHAKGTIIRFEGLKDGVSQTFAFLGKTIALYFRFSLIDPGFRIHLNGELITHAHLKDLAEKTQFIWKIGRCEDPYLNDLEKRFNREKGEHEIKRLSLAGARGFVASVTKPADLKIRTTEERVGIDLFVNGRLRERDLIKHVPTARIVESYLYGQIHFDELDDQVDRFTSSREGIVADDEKFKSFMEDFRTLLLGIVNDWDAWRLKHREGGDPDNSRKSKTERASLSLFHEVTKSFEPSESSPKADQVDGWVEALADDATFNFASYAECFVSENLIRTYIADRAIALSPEALSEAAKFRKKEEASKQKGNVSIKVRRDDGDLSYLAMDDLAYLVDRPKDRNKDASLARDAETFKPMRDAVAHTALLTDQAKKKLTGVRENIKGRVSALLSEK